jgi:hypothetical protein
VRADKGSPPDEPCGWLGEGDVGQLSEEAESRSRNAEMASSNRRGYLSGKTSPPPHKSTSVE